MSVLNSFCYRLVTTFIRLSYEVDSYTQLKEDTLCPMHASVRRCWFCLLVPF
jgi:hypothetical protein